jgi:hypothetical protein
MRKSQASVLAACWRRNARQVERARSGAGWRPAASSTLRTEVAETATPRPLSSPTIRRYPSPDSHEPVEGSSCAAKAQAAAAQASCADTSSVGRRADDANGATSLASRGNSSTLAAEARGSAMPTARGQPGRGADDASADAGSPTRVAEPGSPAPSSDATGPAAAEARRGYGRRDTQTTTASMGLPLDGRQERRHYRGPPAPRRRPRMSLRTLRGLATSVLIGSPEMFPAGRCRHRRRGAGRAPGEGLAERASRINSHTHKRLQRAAPRSAAL